MEKRTNGETGSSPLLHFSASLFLRHRIRPGIWTIILGVVAGLTVPFAWETGSVIGGQNLHEVIPGQIYRSAQLEPDGFRKTVERYHIRTVINLRGACPEAAWYKDECQILKELGVSRCDIALSSGMLPAVPELRHLVMALLTCEYPALLHCRRGADRTGLAAGAVLLLRGKGGLAEAREQLSWRYGHFPMGRPCELSQVFDKYEDWLASGGSEHSADLFYCWASEHYRPGHCWAEIEPLAVPARLQRARPAPATFRVHNRSEFPWRLKQSANSGIHLRYVLHNADKTDSFRGGAGYFNAIVPGGESLELTLSLPPVREPGRYELLVDMVDEERCWFFMAGSPPFRTELEVGD